MKKNLLFVIAALFALQTFAADTLNVKVHNRVYMPNYGYFSQKAVLPSATDSYRKIFMTYTLGCPSNKNCAAFDYTVNIYAMQKTNKIDTFHKQAPSFTVDGNAPDTYSYKKTITYTTKYNTTSKKTDTVANKAQKLIFYSAKDVKSDSLMVYVAGYKNYKYDNTGKKTDSAFVTADSTVSQQKYNYDEYALHYNQVEIARMITPYSQDRVPNFSFPPYIFDVTDYKSVLTDSSELVILYSGYGDGYTSTIDLQYIKGTPDREAYKVIPVYTGSYEYGNPNNSIENFLKPYSINIDAAAVGGVKYRLLQTGHGFGGNGANCAEFCSKYYELKVNNSLAGMNQIWKDDCGENPIQPQTGTWVYNRANWCPGSLVKTYEHEIRQFLTLGQDANVNMDMEYFENDGASNTSYTIGANLILYKAKNFMKDVEITKIISPTTDFAYSRYNPYCGKPTIEIRNNGANMLTAATITYGVKGGIAKTYEWSGNLAFDQSTQIQLPDYTIYNTSADAQIFEVSITVGNDENSDNNALKSSFKNVPVYDKNLIIVFNSNSSPQENSYGIYDMDDNEIFFNNSFNPDATYNDTMNLAPGQYKFLMLDNGGDGLNFFANTQQGKGTIRLKKNGSNSSFKVFNPSFGTSIVHYSE